MPTGKNGPWRFTTIHDLFGLSADLKNCKPTFTGAIAGNVERWKRYPWWRT
ncbi:hypothetical protein [Stutzerimonas kirkiae]|uniref:hypothetical protein n=1 Tax=Stutzerimonas kirkiae TaxID=2211392 RepID=UPI0013F15F0E|nr:hypothetical protein [Stutzerimonas kirkiae]